MKTLLELKNCYDEFIKKSNGNDPDFPMMNFGDKGETYTAKTNSIRNEIISENNQDN